MFRMLVRLGARTLIVGEVLSAVLIAGRSCAQQARTSGEASEAGEGGGSIPVGGSGGSAGGGEAGAAGAIAGGSGGATASGGSGGAAPCEPNGNTCDNAPQGSCSPVDTGCGVLDCSASCGVSPPSGDMTCGAAGQCQCAPFEPVNPSADAACATLNGGASRRCIGATERGIPQSCALLAGDTYCCTL